MDHVVVEPDHRNFAQVARALQDEADGTQWRAELTADLHEALEPGVTAARGAILGMPSAGLPHGGEPLRVAVANQVVSEVSLGRNPGARIRVRKRGMPRGFRNAGKRLNARRGWRHPVFSPDVWTHQLGEPGWFDDTMRRLHPKLRQAALRALDRRARRITRRG
ncbi:hypothetical protein [Micromonospora thermarum]|uniref:Bacteriophage HK97-gp10, tail-component n=1 Tax=Micromonospora thermarum TaxID=2720024 RepID=A0ABX0Z8X3_9ACTN|nr:hypothetical protein [Micromonospora thermarum]NJP33682.1 hypothetical protein [Micromonospora thermarum]